MASEHEYFGHKIVAGILTALPIERVLTDGPLTVWERVVLAACGGLGAGLMILVDRPATYKDAAARVGVGVAVAFLFVPYLVERWGIIGSSGTIALSGGMGILAWYLMGSLLRWLKWAQTSDIVGTLIKLKTGVGPGGERTTEVTVKPVQEPAKPPEKNDQPKPGA